MSGMEPMLIGAALGGGMSAARGGNPITGALLGGIGGGVTGAAFPSLQGGIGNFINGIGTNAMAGGNVAKGLGMNAAMLAGSNGASAIAAQPALSYAGSQLGSAAAESPGILNSIGNAATNVGKYAMANPQQSMALANSLLGEQQQVQPQQAMLAHGTPMQMAPDQQYSMAAPKISLI